MTTMVCFRAAGTAYCIPVGAARSVRLADGLVALPHPAPEVAGLIAGDPPLTVLAALGAGGKHILVMEADAKQFGLLVECVTGLVRVDTGAITLAPTGQSTPLISGTIDNDGQLLMIADPSAMAGRL